MKKCRRAKTKSKIASSVDPGAVPPLNAKRRMHPWLPMTFRSFRPVTPSGIGREKMPREKKLLVGSLVAGSLGIVLAIVLAIVALAIGGLPAAVFSGGVGPSFPHTASWLPSSGPRRVPKKSKTSSPSSFPRLGSWLAASPFCSAFCYS